MVARGGGEGSLGSSCPGAISSGKGGSSGRTARRSWAQWVLGDLGGYPVVELEGNRDDAAEDGLEGGGEAMEGENTRGLDSMGESAT